LPCDIALNNTLVRASEPLYSIDMDPLHAHDSNPSTSVTALVQYFRALNDAMNEKPYVSKIPPPLNFPPINFSGTFQTTTVTDVRSNEQEYQLDVHGFAFMKHLSLSLQSNVTHEDIRSRYLPEMADWLQDITGANEVFIFDYVVSSDGGAKPQHVRYVDCVVSVPNHCCRRRRDATRDCPKNALRYVLMTL
jgi:hypothetical protein